MLARYGGTAVFFLVGQNIAAHGDTVRRIVAEGHEVGNHGWTHMPMDAMTLDQIEDELVSTHREIVRVSGVEPVRFRPPFRRLPAVVTAAVAGYEVIELESSFGDYAMTTDEIVEAAAAVPAHRTVWLHDGHWPTVEALPRVLAQRAALDAAIGRLRERVLTGKWD